MSKEKFCIEELIRPEEMKVYWGLVLISHWVKFTFYRAPRRQTNKTKKNELILILKNTPKHIKFVILYKGTLKVKDCSHVIYTKPENIKITGCAVGSHAFTLEDYLTCDSEVIRKHALEYGKKNGKIG